MGRVRRHPPGSPSPTWPTVSPKLYPRVTPGGVLAGCAGRPASRPLPAGTRGHAHLGQLGVPTHAAGAGGRASAGWRPPRPTSTPAPPRRSTRWYAGAGVDPETGPPHRGDTAGERLDPASSTATAYSPPPMPRSARTGGISVPALAVTGEHDPGSTPEMTHRLAEALPHCRAVVIPGARHMLPVERPRDFVDASNHLHRRVHMTH